VGFRFLEHKTPKLKDVFPAYNAINNPAFTVEFACSFAKLKKEAIIRN